MFGANTYHFADEGVYNALEEHNNWDYSSEELKAKAEAIVCQGDLVTTVTSPIDQSEPDPRSAISTMDMLKAKRLNSQKH